MALRPGGQQNSGRGAHRFYNIPRRISSLRCNFQSIGLVRSSAAERAQNLVHAVSSMRDRRGIPQVDHPP